MSMWNTSCLPSSVRAARRFWISAPALIASVIVLLPPAAFASDIDVVLVHGVNVDGSTWRPVHDILSDEGYDISIVQLPLNGFANDLEATQRVLDRQVDNVLLVGHSYGGVVITTAGNDPKVKALVYVAALQPDTGETIASLSERIPSAMDPDGSVVEQNGYVITTPEAFRRDAAPDVEPGDADFLVASQTPTSTDVFAASTSKPAWREKPTFGVVATQDRVVDPELQRWMYERAGGPITDVEAGHMLILSAPDAVAEAIIEAAKTVTGEEQTGGD